MASVISLSILYVKHPNKRNKSDLEKKRFQSMLNLE